MPELDAWNKSALFFHTSTSQSDCRTNTPVLMIDKSFSVANRLSTNLRRYNLPWCYYKYCWSFNKATLLALIPACFVESADWYHLWKLLQLQPGKSTILFSKVWSTERHIVQPWFYLRTTFWGKYLVCVTEYKYTHRRSLTPKPTNEKFHLWNHISQMKSAFCKSDPYLDVVWNVTPMEFLQMRLSQDGLAAQIRFHTLFSHAAQNADVKKERRRRA